MNDNTIVKNKYSKNNGKAKNHVVAGIILLFTNYFGLNRFYMGKLDFYIYLLPAFLLTIICAMLELNVEVCTSLIWSFFYFASIFEAIVLLAMSDKRFNMICQARKRKIEYRILFTKYDELDSLADELGMIVPSYSYAKVELNTERLNTRAVNGINITVVDKETDTVKDNYIGNGIDGKELDDHEHIKEDIYLKKEIESSQDRLERYKSNDYFPNANYQPKVDVKKQMKELKEELKSGLITKEEYESKLRELR